MLSVDLWMKCPEPDGAVQSDDVQLTQQIFQAFDTDNTGSLGTAQFGSLLQMLYGSRSVPADDVADFIAMLPKLPDGNLDYTVFVEVLSYCPGLPGLACCARLYNDRIRSQTPTHTSFVRVGVAFLLGFSVACLLELCELAKPVEMPRLCYLDSLLLVLLVQDLTTKRYDHKRQHTLLNNIRTWPVLCRRFSCGTMTCLSHQR